MARQLLTARRIQILQKAAEGKSSKQISEDLFISIETVHTHRKIILHKLNAKNMANAVAIGVRKGYIN